MAGFGRKGLGPQSDVSPGLPPGRPAPRLQYDVTPQPLKMLLASGFFGLGVVVFVIELRDPRGLLINHLIRLSPDQADIFFTVLILISAAITGAGLLGFFQSFGDKVFVTLDNHAISGPARYAAVTRIVRVPLAAVREVKVTRIRDQESVVITAEDGRKIRVGRANFRVKAEWSVFLAELRNRLR